MVFITQCTFIANTNHCCLIGDYRVKHLCFIFHASCFSAKMASQLLFFPIRYDFHFPSSSFLCLSISQRIKADIVISCLCAIFRTSFRYSSVAFTIMYFCIVSPPLFCHCFGNTRECFASNLCSFVWR